MPQRIFVVDNNSADNSVERIKEKFPHVEVLELSENLGFAGGNNLAFERLGCVEWVALLNPDTIPETQWIEKVLQSMEKNPDIDVFSSKLVNASDPSMIDGAGDIYHVCGLSWRRHHGLKIGEDLKQDDPVFSPCAAAAVYRRSMIEMVGGFDENYFCYNEDVDLMFRLRHQGAKHLYVESSIVAHVSSGITGKDSDFAIFYGHRNLVWTFVKNMPGMKFYWYLPQHILLNIFSIIYYLFKGRLLVILKSKASAIMGLKRAFRQRRDIQQQRKSKDGDIIACMCKGFFRPYFSRFK